MVLKTALSAAQPPLRSFSLQHSAVSRRSHGIRFAEPEGHESPVFSTPFHPDNGRHRGRDCAGGAAPLRAQRPTLPPPQQSGIDHIVVVMMENRSFDHMLGWVPGADGRQAGLTYTDETGVADSTYPLAPDFQGCGHPDPDHSYEGGRVQFNNGACDGWLRAGESDRYAIG